MTAAALSRTQIKSETIFGHAMMRGTRLATYFGQLYRELGQFLVMLLGVPGWQLTLDNFIQNSDDVRKFLVMPLGGSSWQLNLDNFFQK
jgi:hypothetical protein